mgnify:CR=1 FL=1|jgi:hypothetical protein
MFKPLGAVADVFGQTSKCSITFARHELWAYPLSGDQFLVARMGKVRSGLSEIYGSSLNFMSFSFVAKHEFLWHRPHQLMPRSESRR